MAEHTSGVDMLAQADISELKTMVREYQKEVKDYEAKESKLEKEVERLKRLTGKSYTLGTMWLVGIFSFVIGAGATAAYFLLT